MTSDDRSKGMVMVLSGGVGGAKLVLGFANLLEPDGVLVVANTADDFHHLGLHIAPDIDTIVYTLSGKVDRDRGWGLKDETWTFMDALARLGGEIWFNLGDGDLAMHVERTRRLAAGASLTEVTTGLSVALGLRVRVLPMSDDPVSTIVSTPGGPLAFQHYFVRDRCAPRVDGFCFRGLEQAQPNPIIMQNLDAGRIAAVVIAPSNPFVSIDPILGLPGLREALFGVPGPRIAVSPIVGGAAIKGPAAKMMEELGMPVTAAAVARHYAGFVDAMIIDRLDEDQADDIRSLGMEVVVTQTVMRSLNDRKALAADCMALVKAFAGR